MLKLKIEIFLFLFYIYIMHISSCSKDSDTKNINPYRILGLRRTASHKEIKQAYKRLVMEWHPDKNKKIGAEQRFMEINRAYQILSNPERREAYDKFGFTNTEQMDDLLSYKKFFREQQQQHFQFVHWPPNPKKQQSDLKNFILPFASVIGTLFFIFLIGFLLNHINTSENIKKKRNNHRNTDESPNTSGNKTSKDTEWHPEDPKTPLTEEEKQQRIQARIWRMMGPLIHELRAETQFGLIRLLKPGCRSIIVLVDKESKDILLQQFARHIYCLRNNKTFSFGFLMVPKNLNWFRSLLELTLPDEQQIQEEASKDDLASVSTATTDSSNSNKREKNVEDTCKQTATGENEKEIRKYSNTKMTSRDRLQNINPKHTLGTVLVICGWKLYFSIHHPMHRPSSIRAKGVQLETLGDHELEEEFDGEESGNFEKRGASTILTRRKKSLLKEEINARLDNLHVENVLNGFPTFLDRLLEGTVRRYYVPEWPENLV